MNTKCRRWRKTPTCHCKTAVKIGTDPVARVKDNSCVSMGISLKCIAWKGAPVAKTFKIFQSNTTNLSIPFWKCLTRNREKLRDYSTNFRQKFVMIAVLTQRCKGLQDQLSSLYSGHRQTITTQDTQKKHTIHHILRANCNRLLLLDLHGSNVFNVHSISQADYRVLVVVGLLNQISMN